MKPIKRICNEADIDMFLKTEGLHRLMGFIDDLNGRIIGAKISDFRKTSANVQKIMDMLSVLDGWIDEIPPFEEAQRYGNKAFRVWMERIETVGTHNFVI